VTESERIIISKFLKLYLSSLDNLYKKVNKHQSSRWFYYQSFTTSNQTVLTFVVVEKYPCVEVEADQYPVFSYFCYHALVY